MIYDVITTGDGDEPTVLGQLVESEDWEFKRLLTDGRLHQEGSYEDLEAAIAMIGQEYGPVEFIENTSHYMMGGEPVMEYEAMGPELAMRFDTCCVHVMAVISDDGTPYLELSRSMPKGPRPPDGVSAEDVGVLSLLSSIFRR